LFDLSYLRVRHTTASLRSIQRLEASKFVAFDEACKAQIGKTAVIVLKMLGRKDS
jgi:hypothetical protein